MIKLIFNRFGENTLKQGVDLDLNLNTKETGTKQVTKSISNLRAELEKTEGKNLTLSTSNIDTSIKKLTELKNIIDTIRDNKKDIKIDVISSKLQQSGLSSMLPSGVQDTMTKVSDISGIVSKKSNYNEISKEVNTLIGFLTTLSDKSKETANSLTETGDSATKAGQNIKNVGEDAEKANKNLKNMATSTDLLKQAFNGLEFVKLVYLFRSIRRVTSSIVSMVENAANYEESLNLYRMALGDYVEEATKWEEKISDKLKLDPAEVMKYTGAFYNLVKGLGATSDHAFKMSKNLTQLTYDMASYLNISNEAAQAKIQSAMAGQSRAVATVGVATQMASLQELAYSLNIKKSVSEMTQGEKTYLRYIQLMRQTKQMQGDLGRTMITPANAIRTLKNQINLLGRAIGQVLTPFIMKAIPYIIAFTNILTKAASAIAEFFGYKIAEIDYSSAFNYEDIDATADALNKAGDAASKAGKKASNSLAPFDELNQVMHENSGSGSGSGGGGKIDTSVWDALLPEYDMLKDYTDELVKKSKNLEGVIKKIGTTLLTIAGLKLLADTIVKLVKIRDIINSLDLVNKVPQLKTSVGSIASIITIIAASVVGWKTTTNGIEDQAKTLVKYGESMTFWEKAQNTAAILFETQLRGMIPLAGIISLPYTVMQLLNAETENLQEKVDKKLFGSLSVETEEWTESLRNAYNAMDKYNEVISAHSGKMQSLYSDYQNAEQNVELFGIKFRAVGDQVSKEDTKNMMDSIKTMCESTTQMIDENTNYSLTLWGDTFKNMSTLTDTEENNILKTIMHTGDDQKKELKKAQDNITKTYDKAIKTRGYLTDEEYKYIQTQLQKIHELTQHEMTQNQSDLEYFKIKAANNNLKLDKESYKNFAEALKNYQKEQKDAISKHYNELANDAKTRYDNNEIDYETYIGLMKTAGEQRDQDEKDLAESIRGYQRSVVEGLIDDYDDACQVQSEENDKIKSEIEGIFKDIDVDDTDLLNEFYWSGKAAAGSEINGFEEEENSTSYQSRENNVGKHIMEGIGAGFIATINGSGVYSAAKLAKSLYSGIKKQLGIASPSRLFIKGKIGNYIMQGIGVGMEKELPSITGIANNMLDTVKDAFDKSSDNIGNGLLTSINDAVDAFKDMNNEISSFNNNVNDSAIGSNVSLNKYSNITQDTNYATTGNNSDVIRDAVQSIMVTDASKPVPQPITINLGNETLWKGKVNYDKQQLDRYGSSNVINV